MSAINDNELFMERAAAAALQVVESIFTVGIFKHFPHFPFAISERNDELD